MFVNDGSVAFVQIGDSVQDLLYFVAICLQSGNLAFAWSH